MTIDELVSHIKNYKPSPVPCQIKGWDCQLYIKPLSTEQYAVLFKDETTPYVVRVAIAGTTNAEGVPVFGKEHASCLKSYPAEQVYQLSEAILNLSKIGSEPKNS